MPYGRLAPDDVTDMLVYWNKKMPRWCGLMIGDPFLVSDPLSMEIIGGAYRRPPFALSITDNILRNLQAWSWAVPPMTRVAGYASFDAAHNGKVCSYTPLPDPVDYPVGGTHTLAALSLYIGIDS